MNDRLRKLGTYPMVALEQKKRLLQARGVPIIFSTGYGVDGLPDRFKNVPTLHKPFDLKSFGAALKALLAGTSCELSAA